MLLFLTLLIVIGSSIWVYIDARRLEMKEEGPGDPAHKGPGGWFMFCLVLWIISFPAYLIQRGRYGFRGQPGSATGVKAVGFSLVGVLVLLGVLTFVGSIKMTTPDLEQQVQQSMKEHLAKSPQYGEAVVKGVQLVHKSGNEYEGLVTLSLRGSEIIQPVEVVFDGKQFMWRMR